MGTESFERRARERQTACVCAWLAFRGSGIPRGTVTLDLSLGGGRFSSIRDTKPEQEALVDLQLTPPAFPIRCKARVRWSRHMDNGLYEFGVKFLDFADDERQALDDFLEAHSRKEAFA